MLLQLDILMRANQTTRILHEKAAELRVRIKNEPWWRHPYRLQLREVLKTIQMLENFEVHAERLIRKRLNHAISALDQKSRGLLIAALNEVGREEN